MERNQETEEKSYKKARIQGCSMKDVGVSEAVAYGKGEVATVESHSESDAVSDTDSEDDIIPPIEVYPKRRDSSDSNSSDDDDDDIIPIKEAAATPIEVPPSECGVTNKMREEYQKYIQESNNNPIHLHKWMQLPVSGEDTRTNFQKYVDEMRKHRYANASPAAQKYQQETRKYEGFYFSHEFPVDRLKGGYMRVTPDCLEACVPATEAAVSHYNKSNNTELKATKLLRANNAYFRYNLTFEMSDGQVYEARVDYNPRKRPLISRVLLMRPARHFPDNKEAYTYHDFTSQVI